MVELYLHSPMCLHGVLINLTQEAILPTLASRPSEGRAENLTTRRRGTWEE
jgi:hypothetical protein